MYKFQLQGLGLGLIPHVLELLWIFIQIVELSQVVAMVDDQFVTSIAIHRGERSVGRLQGVIILAAHELARSLIRRRSVERREQRSTLHVGGYVQAGEFQQGGRNIEEFHQ